MESRTAIFSMLVRDAMRDVPLAVPMATTLREATQRMEYNNASSATVTDTDGHTGAIAGPRIDKANKTGGRKNPPPVYLFKLRRLAGCNSDSNQNRERGYDINHRGNFKLFGFFGHLLFSEIQ